MLLTCLRSRDWKYLIGCLTDISRFTIVWFLSYNYTNIFFKFSDKIITYYCMKQKKISLYLSFSLSYCGLWEIQARQKTIFVALMQVLLVSMVSRVLERSQVGACRRPLTYQVWEVNTVERNPVLPLYPLVVQVCSQSLPVHCAVEVVYLSQLVTLSRVYLEDSTCDTGTLQFNWPSLHIRHSPSLIGPHFLYIHLYGMPLDNIYQMRLLPCAHLKSHPLSLHLSCSVVSVLCRSCGNWANQTEWTLRVGRRCHQVWCCNYILLPLSV